VTEDDPLASLVIDAAELDRSRIAAALRGRIAFDRSTSAPVIQSGFNDWDTNQKILGFLLGRKAGVLLGVSDQEAVMPITVGSQTGLAPGTIRPGLRGLLQQRRVSQDNKGAYFLTAPQVIAALDTLATRPTVERGKSTKKRRLKGAPPKDRASERPSQILKQPVTVSKPHQKVKQKKGGANTAKRSPTALVMQLIDQGFFDSARTLSSAQKRLRDKTGHQIKITTLSPVFTRLLRSHLFDREESDEGYVYVRHSAK